MNTEKLEKLKKSLDNKFIPDNMKDKIRAEIKKLEADIKTDETITATEVKEEVKEIEKKVEKALEVAEEKEEKAEAKKEEAEERAEAKAEEKKAKKIRTKTPKTDEKPKSAKKSVFSIAKEIRKDNESWEDAKERARKMMKSETTETKKKTKTETQKLLAMVRRNKEYKKLTGSSNLAKDATRRALARGKRVSADGNVYYENRANRVDVGGFKNAYLENGGGVDGIIELKPLELIPLSTQLNRLSGYNWTSGDWESEDGGKPSTMPNSVIVNVHTKQKFRLSPFYVYKGIDHYNSKPLYRVEDMSEEGEYVGEWYTNREEAVQELKEMFGSYADKGVYVETLDEEIDLTDDGKPRVIKTQQGGNKSFGERREMHGASPEALAFDNGGKVGRYSILGEVDGQKPVLYATTDDKERIKPLVNMAEIDLYELTGKNHRIFVTDEVTDDEVYHYGNGGRTRERRYVNHSQDYEVRYSKDKPHRRGYGYENGGSIEDERFKKFINSQVSYIISLKTISQKREPIQNLLDNMEDYRSGSEILKRITTDNLKYALQQKTVSKMNEVLRISLNALEYADGGTIIGTPETPLARGLDIDYTGLVGETGGMSAGEMFAEGGSLGNHGLKQGDQIIKTMSGGVQKVKTKSGDIVYVNLANGYRGVTPPLPFANGGEIEKYKSQGWKKTNRSTHGFDVYSKKIEEDTHYAVFDKRGNFLSRSKNNPQQAEIEAYQYMTKYAKGGYTNERRHVNKSQDYEVRYAKNKPNRTGYLGKRSFDDGGISNGRYEVVKVIGFDKNGKTLPKNEIKVIADFDSRKEALNFVYEQQFKKDVTQRDIFIRDTKTNKTFAEGGFMTDPNFGDFQNQVYATGGGVEQTQYVLFKTEKDLKKITDVLKEYDGYTNESDRMRNSNKLYHNVDGKMMILFSNSSVDKILDLSRGYGVEVEKFSKEKDYNYATGGVTKNYIGRNQLNTITIKKGNQKLTYKVSDVYNGAYKLEEGGNLEKTAFYVSKRNVVKVQLKDGRDVKVANGYWIKKGAKPIHTSKYDDGGMTEKEFMQKEINSQKEIEKGKVFKKYRVNVYENGFPFVDPLMTDNLLEAINFAKKTIEEQRKYRASSKDLFAQISEFTPIEKRDNVRYAYNTIGSLSEEDLKSSKYNDGGQLEMKFLKGGKLESKIQKKVDEVNSLIEKAIDKDGDPIMVVDKSGTWEEPMQYKPIVYKNGRLYFEYYEPYSGKTQKEVVNKSNIEFDGYPMLLDIAKMYRRALKEKGVSYAGGGNLNYGIPKEDLENYKIEEVLKDIVDIDYDNSNLEKSKYIILAKPINNNYKNNWYEPKVFIITEKGIYTISNVKKSKWEEIKKDIFDNELTFEKYGYFKIMLNGGKTTFKEKATAIAKKFEGKKVEPKYQKEYGKTYDKAEAKEVGNKIAGSQKAKYDAKMSGGGYLKNGYFKNEIDNDYIEEINKYYNKWNSIKDEKDSENFKKTKPPMFGTYQETDILNQIKHFEKLDIPFQANEVSRNQFKKEVSKIIDNFTNKKSYGKGGSTKRGGAMQLAKQIRKEGESWQSALKRANEQMRKK